MSHQEFAIDLVAYLNLILLKLSQAHAGAKAGVGDFHRGNTSHF